MRALDREQAEVRYSEGMRDINSGPQLKRKSPSCESDRSLWRHQGAGLAVDLRR